jgi:hypothetical protein
MKKLLAYLLFFIISISLVGQPGSVITSNFTIRKASPAFYLNGTNAFIDFYNNEVRLTQGNDVLTLSGGNFALAGGYSLLLTGSIGSTGSRVTKGWFTDVESTNMITVGGNSLSTIFAPISHTQAQSTITALSDSLLARYNKTQANTRLNLKFNISDTATMLSKYPHKLNAVLTGVPTVPTAAAGTNTTQIATTAFTTTADNLKLNIANGTATGTLTTAALNVGGRNLTIDSIPLINGEYAVFVGPDTMPVHILKTQQIELFDALDTNLVIATKHDIITLYDDTTRVFNILQYGATDGGTVEDQTAIRNAMIDAAELPYGGTVVIPSGSWYITDTILMESNITIDIDRNARITIAPSYAKCVFSFPGRVERTTIKGGYFYGTTQTWNFANLYATDATHPITECHFEDININNCKIGFNVSIISDGWVNANNFNNLTISSCINALKIADAVDGGNSFDGNLFSNIMVQATTNTTNVIDNFEGSTNQFVNFYVWDLTGAQKAFVLSANSARNRLIGSFGTEASYITNLGINNYILNQGYNINTSRDLTYLSASSGLEIDKQASIIYYHQTSSLDITANPQFTDGFDGKEITIIGSSDTYYLKLDDGNGLKLATPNILLGAGDIITFIYNASLDLWVEKSRQEASPIQTVKRTIGIAGRTGMDFSFASAANSDAQNIDLGAIIPAKARVIGVEIVCYEDLGGSGSQEILMRAGNASTGEQFIADISCNVTNEVAGIIDATKSAAVIMNYATATNIFIGGNPDANWNTYTYGRWRVYVTYINYSNY